MCTALDELIESGKEKLLTEMVEKKLAKNKTPDTIETAGKPAGFTLLAGVFL